MDKFNWEDFMNRKIVVHCEDKEKAMDFLKECNNKGLRWVNGDEATDFDDYSMYGRETCVAYTPDCGLGYADREYYSEEEAVKIVKWKDKDDFNSKDLILNLFNTFFSYGDCSGISCSGDNCPFFNRGCCLIQREERIKIANQYLKDNEIKENNKMKKTGREVLDTIKDGETWESEYRVIKRIGNNLCIGRKQGEKAMDVLIDLTNTYTLQRKQYSFYEVYNVFKEGEEIENCTTGVKLILEGNVIKYKHPNMPTWEIIDKEHNIFSTEDILNNMWYINE